MSKPALLYYCQPGRGMGGMVRAITIAGHLTNRFQVSILSSGVVPSGIKIPAGVDNGDRIRLAREGEAGRNGGPPGDLYVDIGVLEHQIFSREAQDLSCEVPISFATAALGGSIEVPTLDGQVVLKVPAETQSGKIFRLKGKGVRSVRASGVGDLYCRVQVETPIKLSEEQKAQLAAFDTTVQSEGARHSPKATSWFDGVKRFFDRMGA